MDQSADALRLTVVDGAVDLRELRLLDTGRLEHGGLALRAAIIGASHLLELRAAGLPALTEVLACVDLPSASGGGRGAVRVRSVGESLSWRTAGLDYRFESVRQKTSDARERLARLEARSAAARRAADASSDERPVGLAFTFPNGSGPEGGSGGAQPRTVLWAGPDPAGRGIRVETAHCYPNDAAVVFSRTRVARLPAASGVRP